MRLNLQTYQRDGMDNAELMRKAPSVFAETAWGQMSAKYTFIPTIGVVEKMRNEGFVPVSVRQSNTRIEGRGEFTKHQIRFRDARSGNIALAPHLGMLYPEIILTNAHDGGSSFQIDAGMLRLACMNGLMVSEATVNQVRARHSGSADGVIEAAFEVIEQFPTVLESVERFGQLRLSAPEREIFAETALALKYDEAAPVTPNQVLRTHRREDADANLWNTFNVVQENLVNGGTRGFNRQTMRRVTTRAVNGISESTRLNKALWTLTERMAALKAAA